jgi:NAD(P)-dependent dehydrogenase (short-subunit alcohol dehydrogenase family)
MMEIAGKTAIVTGAASGIGLGIASALSQAGVKVMLCDIEDAAPVKAVADLKLTNADVDGVRADVSLKDSRSGLAWFAPISRDSRYAQMLPRLANLAADFPFNLPFFREQLT